MDIDQLIGKFYNRLKKADIAGTEGVVAASTYGHLRGSHRVPNGNVSVMPYEYIDHDANCFRFDDYLEKMLTGVGPAGCYR